MNKTLPMVTSFKMTSVTEWMFEFSTQNYIVNWNVDDIRIELEIQETAHTLKVNFDESWFQPVGEVAIFI